MRALLTWQCDSTPLDPPSSGRVLLHAEGGRTEQCASWYRCQQNPHTYQLARPVKTGRWLADRPAERTRCTRLQTIGDKLLSFYGSAKQ